MAQMITVTARTPFVYQTRALSVGDRFECLPVWAAILRDQGKIALASDRQPVVVVIPPSVEASYPSSNIREGVPDEPLASTATTAVVRTRRARRAVDPVIAPDPVPAA